jgi:hypothetical protein
MPTPFPANSWNIQVVATGSPQGGNNLQGRTFEIVGSMPPQTGMPILYSYFPVTPQRYIQQVDSNTGLVTVAVSGATGDQLFNRNHPWEVQIDIKDATAWGWPTGVNCVKSGHSPYVFPTGAGPVRGNDLMPGGGFIYG